MQGGRDMENIEGAAAEARAVGAGQATRECQYRRQGKVGADHGAGGEVSLQRLPASTISAREHSQRKRRSWSALSISNCCQVVSSKGLAAPVTAERAAAVLSFLPSL